MGDTLFLHFLFAFAIYPVKKTYWKTIFYGRGWALGWGYYPILVVGWSIILLWIYIGAMWLVYLGLFREGIPRVHETLGTIYIGVWFLIVIWFSLKAWIVAGDEDDEYYRTR